MWDEVTVTLLAPLLLPVALTHSVPLPLPGELGVVDTVSVLV